MKLLLALWFAAAAALTGCSLAPDHVRPALPVAGDWVPADRTTAAAGRPAQWRQFFVAPELTGLIEAALSNSRDLRIAIWRVEAARGQYRIRRADGVPQISANAAGFRSQIPASLSPTANRVTENLFAGYVSASWDIDLWGRIGNLDAAAMQRFIASDEARQTIALSLIANVANAWLSGRELDERIALADVTVESRRDSARIARRRYEVGAAPRIDQAQADALFGDAESSLIILEQQREQNRSALTLLVGAPVPVAASLLSEVEDSVVHDLPPGLPSILLTQRPDIRGAENRLRAAEQNIGAARAAFFPRISLIGDGGVASSALNTLFTGNGTLWSFGASLAMPIFDGGRLSGALDEARAQRQIAIAEYERTVQAAFRDVSDALAARRRLTAQILTERRSLDALRDRARLADVRYRAGASTYLEVLEAQRDLFGLEQALVQTRRARLSSEVNLFAALGGGEDDASRATAATTAEGAKP